MDSPRDQFLAMARVAPHASSALTAQLHELLRPLCAQHGTVLLDRAQFDEARADNIMFERMAQSTNSAVGVTPGDVAATLALFAQNIAYTMGRQIDQMWPITIYAESEKTQEDDYLYHTVQLHVQWQ